MRPIQDRLNKRSFHDPSQLAGGSTKMPVFLEQEENRSEELLPANKNSIRSSFQCHGVKHRTGRAPVAHRRSWSVGGSNVHQTMMRRSEPHLHRLDLTQDTIQEKDRRSPLFIGPALIESREEQDRRRGSILVDAETQTDVRSKGDGISIDSPTVHLKNVNAGRIQFDYWMTSKLS